MTDYTPINSNGLRTDTKVGCDLYLLVKTTTDNRYVLYCKGDSIFERDKRDKLVEKNISRLFIKRDDQQKYYEYLESNFQEIISDISIPADDRTKIVYSAANNLVKDLFNDPRAGNVERTKTFAYNIVDYILKDKNAARSLLKIAIHEYYTYTHSVNVATVGTVFVKYLGFNEDELKHFCTGTLLHDIGKTRISTNILNKKDKLTKEEFELMKKHPELGVEILKGIRDSFTEECIITLQHHENYDGSGYPQGLKRDEIHHFGKIARIIDVYDALTTNRPYADAIRPFSALVEMMEKMPNCFDMELLKEFIRFAGPFDPRKKKRKGDMLQNL